MNATETIGDVMTITTDAIEASIRNVYHANNEMAKVIEGLDDDAGRALCLAVCTIFVPDLSDFDRASTVKVYTDAIKAIASVQLADDILRAIIADIVMHGGPAIGMDRLARVEKAFVAW